MKKMLFMCLVAVSLVGCTANTETKENTESTNQTETVDDSSTEDFSIELTDTESMENFQAYMQNNEVEESKKIILPPYTEDDFVLFQVKKGLSDSDRAVIHLQQTCGKPTPLGVGWIAHLFYSSMCMLLLILYTYYDIVDVWKTNIDIQTQQYL